VGDQRRVEIGGIIKCNLSVSQKTLREFAGQFCCAGSDGIVHASMQKRRNSQKTFQPR
jgi:iron-sulfur cluster repair protein YtfE (RIC family)